ncbi:MAG: DUF1003 domain-containing protein [Patescibacteria group bacterium]|jgi:uncharacterized membrane protein|nr:DUF1003 domain-containing protein [Patescibacteria group bacterium]
MAKKRITFGQRASGRITRIVGSWKFIIIQSIILIIWITMNVLAWSNHWDPYPFIFLNLALSFQAAYTAPIILMSENRELDMERKKTALDLATDRKTEREIQKIKKQLERLERGKIDKILKIIEKK